MARKILPVVQQASNFWQIPAELLQAVVDTEGGEQAMVRAVQCSLPSVKTLEKAIEVLCRSLVHRMFQVVEGADGMGAVIDHFATFWAPVGAANDPKGLNAHWPENVKRIYAELRKGRLGS